WLPKPAMEYVARMLDIPYVRVLEIATFYTMFNLEPVGRYFIQLCGTTPCALVGAEGLRQYLLDTIGPERQVTPDGFFSWAEVECLGACCNAPMVQINDEYYEDLTLEGFAQMIETLARGGALRPGSQQGRRSSEPFGELTT